MPMKDGDYVPKLWSYDTTGEAVVLSQKELKSLRDELNKEYLRRWSGYMSCYYIMGGEKIYAENGFWENKNFMDVQSSQWESKDKWDEHVTKPEGAWDVGAFTDADGKHRARDVIGAPEGEEWNWPLPDPKPILDKNTPLDYRHSHTGSEVPYYYNADGNIRNDYWGTLARKDYRGCPIYYGGMDRYVDGVVTYDLLADKAPVVESGYKGPTSGMTFPLGATEWKDKNGNDPNTRYNPFGFKDVTKDRSFKHLIDGLANIVDIDKYYGHGVRHDDPINPYNPVRYGDDQVPHNSERTEHFYRQTGNVDIHTAGSQSRLTRNNSIASWLPILRKERRNDWYVRACNYQHWIWYFQDIEYVSNWTYSSPIDFEYVIAIPGGKNRPYVKTYPNISYESSTSDGKLRTNYNPSYYGHKGSYTSCLTACTGFCSQSCFHVCDEQCVYLCDDKCGYSCMDGGQVACGSVCIANCRDNCGGNLQEGGNGGNTCQSSCTGAARQLPDSCDGQCSGGCDGFMKDRQACGNNCVGYCSDSCTTICVGGCKITCSTDACNRSCTYGCTGSAAAAPSTSGGSSSSGDGPKSPQTGDPGYNKGGAGKDKPNKGEGSGGSGNKTGNMGTPHPWASEGAI